jgi:hypothetical protein
MAGFANLLMAAIWLASSIIPVLISGEIMLIVDLLSDIMIVIQLI